MGLFWFSPGDLDLKRSPKTYLNPPWAPESARGAKHKWLIVRRSRRAVDRPLVFRRNPAAGLEIGFEVGFKPRAKSQEPRAASLWPVAYRRSRLAVDGLVRSWPVLPPSVRCGRYRC